MMFKKILLVLILLSITSCKKDNPVTPADGGSTGTTGDLWTAKTSMPTSRGYLCCAEVDGKIYVIGGIRDLTPIISDAVEVYDPATDKWISKNPMPEKILGLAAAALNGKIYTFGGRTGALYSGTTLNYTYLYDPAADTWTRKADMLSAKAFVTAAAADGKIYIFGGAHSGYEGISGVQMYDPAADVWTTKANLPKGSSYPTATASDGKIYVIGGGTSQDAGAGTAFADFDVYTTSSDSWEFKEDIAQSRIGHGAGLINNKLYICGGFSSSTELKDLMEYDIINDKWTSRASMSSPRRCFATCSYNGKLYVIGGITGGAGVSHSLNSVIEYTPPGQ